MNRLSICVLLLLCQSCSIGENKDNFPKSPIRFRSPNKVYARDSFYLTYTVNQFITNDVQGYGGIKKEDFLRIDIDTILYSPDTLKLFSFVITYIRDTEDKAIPYYYDGQTLIAYRANTHMPWLVYPGHPFAAFLGYENYNKVKNRMKIEFFEKFKDEGLWYWNNEQKETQTFIYKYNINDYKFWDSSYVWKKGLSIPGYYIFQQKGNVKPDGNDIIFKLPEMRYPDSLLKLYYENKW